MSKQTVNSIINKKSRNVANEDSVAKKLLGPIAESPDVIPQLAEFPNVHNGVKSDLDCNPFPNQYPSFPKSNTLDNIFKDFKEGHLSIFGLAGSGKTTLLRTIGRNVCDKKYEGLKEIEVVVFLNCPDIDPDPKREKLPIAHLLSSLQDITESEQRHISKFAKESPQKVLFIIDGLDTFTGNLNSVKQPICKPSKTATSAETLHSLLSGHLFSKCRVITSTRGHIVADYKDFHPNKIVGLVGLTFNDIYAVTRTYFKENDANNIMDGLQKTPSLMKLCQTPVFLIFTLIGRKHDPNFTPTTMSQILVFLFQNFLLSEHAHGGNNEDVVRRLQPLSFRLIRENKINFSAVDLNSEGLRQEDLKDLAITIPDVHGKMICFIHRSIQEMLAAFHVAGLEFIAFCKFVSKNRNMPKYRVVRRMLCGIICDERLRKDSVRFFEDEKLPEKRAFLQEALKRDVSSIKFNDPGQDILELINCLYETGEGAKDVITESLEQIAIRNLPPYYLLSPSDLHAIGTIVGQCRNLEELAITSGNLQDRDIEMLYHCIAESTVRISHIDMSLNPSTLSGYEYLGKMAKHCKTKQLDAVGKKLTNNHLVALKRGLSDFQVEHLDISYDRAMDTKEKMTPETRSRTVQIPITVDATRLPDELKKLGDSEPLVMEIGWFKLGWFKQWTDAPYDLVYAITCLFPNISENIILYGWKIKREYHDLIQTKLDECSTNLKVHITKSIILRSEKSVDLQAEAGAELVHAFSQPAKTTLQTNIPCDNIERRRLCQSNFSDVERCIKEEKAENGCTLQKPLEVQIAHRSLTDTGIKFLATKLHDCKEVQVLELRECGLDRETLANFAQTIGQTECKIQTFSVSICKNFHDLLPGICDVVKQNGTKNLSITENDVTGKDISELKTLLHDKKVSELCGLDISDNQNIRDLRPLGLLVKSHELTDLTMMSCELTDELLEPLSTVHSSTIKSLNISYNSDITRSGFKHFTTLLHPKGLDLLDVSGCELTNDKLDGLTELLENREIAKLNATYNDFCCSEIETLGKFSAKSNVHEISLAGCGLGGSHLESFEGSLGEHKFYSIDIADNSGIAGSVEDVARLTTRCSSLDISECGFRAEMVDELGSAMNERTIETLNVSDSNCVLTKRSRMLTSLLTFLPTVTKVLFVCFKSVDKYSKDMLRSKPGGSGKNGPRIVFDQGHDCVDENDFNFVMPQRED